MISSFSSVFPLLLLALLPLLGINGRQFGNANDEAGEYFSNCCQEIIGLPADIAEIACKYPPGNLSIAQEHVLAQVFAEYIGCYAAHKNNRECCAEGGCTGKYLACQDLCDGENPPRPSSKYLNCGDKKTVISDCNKAAWGGQAVVSPKDPRHNHVDSVKKLHKVQGLVAEVMADLVASVLPKMPWQQ